MRLSIAPVGILFLSFLLTFNGFAQHLQPGFDKEEYSETLKINQKTHIKLDQWATDSLVPLPEHYTFEYRSPVVAFDNIWDLWMHREQPIAMIAIQGSIQTEASFLANLYAAMIPATGSIQLEDDYIFNYQLSQSSKAAVQVGWFVAMAYLSKTILVKIDSCYQSGIKDFILTGHSQGGGITYMLTAYLHYLQVNKQLPADIRFKTYCSAGPKPGNLFFAYDYENYTAGGWAYNVVNTEDWVPQVPFTVQTIDDFPATNPFAYALPIIRKQKFPKNLVLKSVYNKLSKPSKKAQRNYEKYLGKMVSKAVKKQLPAFRTPEYYHSNFYVRTGSTIVLTPDASYYQHFQMETKPPTIWQHNLPEMYLYLLDRL